MKFISTRSNNSAFGNWTALSFSEALQAGLARDEGLYVPEKFPSFAGNLISSYLPLSEIAEKVLKPFFKDDQLEDTLSDICEKAFNFPIPVEFLDQETAILELFHGPTAAFKDVGARFLAECITRLPSKSCNPSRVLVATSGDTGGAVAAAFFQKPGIQVSILYPKDKISSRQEKQLTGWGSNVRAFAVLGDFDDCQRMVKEAFLDEELKEKYELISANSINIGRILPQVVYYVYASLFYFERKGEEVNIIVPSGNLGNATAALWAKEMGFPIKSVTLALNSNRFVLDFFENQQWMDRKAIPTIANAMDVSNPSNLERILHLYPEWNKLYSSINVTSASDEDIKRSIIDAKNWWGITVCPHTAAGVFASTQLNKKHNILVATAHPAKFDTIVEPLIGKSIEVPKELKQILSNPSLYSIIKPTLESLKSEL